MKQHTSKDYARLFDLVFNHHFAVPCRLEYRRDALSPVLIVHAAVKKTEEGIHVGVLGRDYASADAFQVRLSPHFDSVEDMFVADCKRDNLEWFDTFQ